MDEERKPEDERGERAAPGGATRAGTGRPERRPIPRVAPAQPAGPPKLTPREEEMLRRIQAALPYVERDTRVLRGLGLLVPAERVHEALATLKSLPGVLCDHLSCVSGVDWQDAIEVAYHLFRTDDPEVRIVVKARLPYTGDEMPEVASVVDLWEAANWHEREIYDLLGVRFLGHPDLRRILLPESYQGGFPLRKSFVDRRPKRQRVVRAR
ncbi:MAG: NADH-quinone oxidoreductase subunit C [Clostridia bacterium]|nr:NADH-quinone oxidoreductase subunit C [Clostridia bacterium]